MSAREPGRVFLAHGQDVGRMTALARLLEAQGLATIDPASEAETSFRKTVESTLSRADIVIADLTGFNPNVFYELGLARALSIPTILIMDNKAEGVLPTDLAGAQIIFYDDANPASMENRVTKAVERLVA